MISNTIFQRGDAYFLDAVINFIDRYDINHEFTRHQSVLARLCDTARDIETIDKLSRLLNIKHGDADIFRVLLENLNTDEIESAYGVDPKIIDLYQRYLEISEMVTEEKINDSF